MIFSSFCPANKRTYGPVSVYGWDRHRGHKDGGWLTARRAFRAISEPPPPVIRGLCQETRDLRTREMTTALEPAMIAPAGCASSVPAPLTFATPDAEIKPQIVRINAQGDRIVTSASTNARRSAALAGEGVVA